MDADTPITLEEVFAEGPDLGVLFAAAQEARATFEGAAGDLPELAALHAAQQAHRAALTRLEEGPLGQEYRARNNAFIVAVNAWKGKVYEVGGIDLDGEPF